MLINHVNDNGVTLNLTLSRDKRESVIGKKKIEEHFIEEITNSFTSIRPITDIILMNDNSSSVKLTQKSIDAFLYLLDNIKDTLESVYIFWFNQNQDFINNLIYRLNPKKIKNLVINNCGLTGGFPKGINKLLNLKTLNLGNNNIDTIDIDLSKFKELNDLGLSYTLIDKFDSNLRSNTNLKSLALNSTKLSKLNLDLFNLSSICKINIDNVSNLELTIDKNKDMAYTGEINLNHLDTTVNKNTNVLRWFLLSVNKIDKYQENHLLYKHQSTLSFDFTNKEMLNALLNCNTFDNAIFVLSKHSCVHNNHIIKNIKKDFAKRCIAIGIFINLAKKYLGTKQ